MDNSFYLISGFSVDGTLSMVVSEAAWSDASWWRLEEKATSI
ncbi:hypothetical protein [Corynebacterium lactis]|nr:hypothetical protein [Corynebacterium lactis]